MKRTADVVWNATVRSTSGIFTTPPVGTPCTIEARLEGGESRVEGEPLVHVDYHHIVVCCGGATLYDAAKPGGGHLSGEARESRAAAGAFVYELRYFDLGPRSPDDRPQLEIISEHGVARVSYDGVRAGAVDLTVDRTSQPRKGDALVIPDAK